MKKTILAAITVMAFITPCHAQSDSTISAMKQQKKVLEHNTELTKTEIEYQKAVDKTIDLEKEAAEANANANVSGPVGYSTQNAAETAQNAKERVKMLKKVKKANAKLACSRKKVQKLDKKKKAIKAKLAKMDQRVEVVNQ